MGSKYSQYKSRAKYKGIEFKLSVEDFNFITSMDCFYCKTDEDVIGIDRVDNSKGYIIGNIAPCCWTCNRAKSNMSRLDFFNYRERFNTSEKTKPTGGFRGSLLK